jgi:hypothetical protein
MASIATRRCETFKLREHPKALRYLFLPLQGREKNGNNPRDPYIRMGNPQPSSSYALCIKRESAVQRPNVSWFPLSVEA